MPLAVAIHHQAPPRCCAGKVRYRTLDRAQEALIRVCAAFHNGRRHDPAPFAPMNVYACRVCGSWHIGHRPKEIAA